MPKEQPSNFPVGSKEWFGAINASSRIPKLEVAKMLDANAQNIFKEQTLIDAVIPFLNTDVSRLGEPGLYGRLAETFSSKVISMAKTVKLSKSDGVFQSFIARVYIDLVQTHLKPESQVAPVTTTRKNKTGESEVVSVTDPQQNLESKLTAMRKYLARFEKSLSEQEKEQAELLMYAFRLSSFDRDRLLKQIHNTKETKTKKAIANNWAPLQAKVREMKAREQARESSR